MQAVLKKPIQHGFNLFALYNAVISWVDALLSVPQTALAGVLKSSFSDPETSQKFTTINRNRRDLYRVNLEKKIKNLINIFKENTSYEDDGIKLGFSWEEFETMLLNNDFEQLKQVLDSQLKKNTLEQFEALPFVLRQLLFIHREKIFKEENLPSIQKSAIQEEDTLKEEFEQVLGKFPHEKPGCKVDEILMKTLVNFFQVSEKDFIKPKEFEVVVFKYGQEIGEKLHISGEKNNFRTAFELMVLISMFLFLYATKISKAVLLTPFEILKIMITGCIKAIDPQLLQNDEIDKMIISLKNPINEFAATYNATYESLCHRDDYKDPMGKNGPMKILLRLIAEKLSDFSDPLAGDVVLAILEDHQIMDDVKDAGINIELRNPAYIVLAVLESIPIFIEQIIYTVCYSFGGHCKSFHEYINSPKIDQKELVVQ